MYQNPEITPTEFAQALAAGAALAEGKLFEINDTPAVLVPEGYRLETFDSLREAPPRINQVVRATTADAFVSYVKRFSTSATLVFCDIAASQFIAILDYHDQTLADWCGHRIVYTCPHSKEWEMWKFYSGKPLEQKVFAEFIEDNLTDIVEPVGAEMLEIARSLDAKTNVRYKSAVRLDNGETQFVYEEVIDGAAGAKGQLKIPQVIKLALRVFQGEIPYAVEARFKYRLRDGALTMWYELVRPHRIIEDSTREVVNRIRDALGEIPVLEAVAE